MWTYYICGNFLAAHGILAQKITADDMFFTTSTKSDTRSIYSQLIPKRPDGQPIDEYNHVLEEGFFGICVSFPELRRCHEDFRKHGSFMDMLQMLTTSL